MKYVKKPVIVEANQWFEHGNDVRVINRWPDLINSHVCEHCNGSVAEHGWIKTLEGGHIVCPGDYIITGVKGEAYPCKPEIFDLTYEIYHESGGRY